jgi:hypothetical protein
MKTYDPTYDPPAAVLDVTIINPFLKVILELPEEV